MARRQRRRQQRPLFPPPRERPCKSARGGCERHARSARRLPHRRATTRLLRGNPEYRRRQLRWLERRQSRWRVRRTHPAYEPTLFDYSDPAAARCPLSQAPKSVELFTWPPNIRARGKVSRLLSGPGQFAAKKSGALAPGALVAAHTIQSEGVAEASYCPSPDSTPLIQLAACTSY